MRNPAGSQTTSHPIRPRRPRTVQRVDWPSGPHARSVSNPAAQAARPTTTPASKTAVMRRSNGTHKLHRQGQSAPEGHADQAQGHPGGNPAARVSRRSEVSPQDEGRHGVNPPNAARWPASRAKACPGRCSGAASRPSSWRNRPPPSKTVAIATATAIVGMWCVLPSSAAHRPPWPITTPVSKLTVRVSNSMTRSATSPARRAENGGHTRRVLGDHQGRSTQVFPQLVVW